MREKYGKIMAATIVFILVIWVFGMAARFEFDREVEAQKREVSNRINVLAAKIEGRISSYIFYGNATKAYIQSRTVIDEKDLLDFLGNLIGQKDPNFRNFAILKDTTIVYVYPKEDNKSAIGRDLSKVAGQMESVLAVKRLGTVMVTGPVTLVQGGKGIVIRIPVHSVHQGGKEAYWGQVSEVLQYDALTKSVQMDSYFKNLNMKIYENSELERIERVVWSNFEGRYADSIRSQIHLPQSEWIIEAEPKSGWQGTTATFSLLLILGLVSALFGAMYVYTLLGTKEKLQKLVDERTSSLETSLQDLKQTQEQLIASEKLASLGELVAGVAHEINTPLGIAVTLSSYISERHDQFKTACEGELLSKKVLTEYLAAVDEAVELTVRNLGRVSDIVVNFKQVAVDQNSQELRKINLESYLQSVMGNLIPKIKHTQHSIEVHCEGEMEMISYPGAIAQIVTNLVLNSLIHGFDGIEEGHISLEVGRKGNKVVLNYRDDGRGIANAALDKVFNPFYTTRKNMGSTGLGLHIIHNLVTQVLHGRVQLSSEESSGVLFHIEFPCMDDKEYQAFLETHTMEV